MEWKDPKIVASHYAFALRVIHLSCGIYLWEYISTFGFELRIYTGKRPFQWSSLIYIGSRFFGLVFCLDVLGGYNTTHEIDCQAWWQSVFAFGALSLELATALLCLRVIAFWQRLPAILVTVGVLYSANIISVVYGGFQALSEWDNYTMGCMPRQSQAILPVAGLFLITDFAHFSLMLAGLWRTRSSGSLWVLARHQGLTWMLAAALIEIPVIILLKLNLNESLNLLLQIPYMTTLVICATRMYRSMLMFSESSTVQINSNGIGAPTIASRMAFARNPNIDPSTTVALVGPSDNLLLESGPVDSFAHTTRTEIP